MKLILTTNEGTEVLRMDTDDVRPADVVSAITNIPKPKKRRSDAGKPRVATNGEGADAQE